MDRLDINNMKEILDRINASNGFTKHNNMIITSVVTGQAEGTLMITPEAVNYYGNVHGGALFSLADYVAGVAAASHGTVCVTLDANIHYFKPVSLGIVRAVATETNKSKKTGIYEVCLHDEGASLVAKAIFTYYNTEKPI